MTSAYPVLQCADDESAPESPPPQVSPAVVYWKRVASPNSVAVFRDDSFRDDSNNGKQERFAPKLPCLDEDNELATNETADLTDSGILFETNAIDDLSNADADGPIRTTNSASTSPTKKESKRRRIKELQHEATELAGRGEEEEAMKRYREAIRMAGTEISRINFRIVQSQSRPHEATRASIQQHLRGDLLKIGRIIGKMRTKMALLYERTGDFDRAIACCREAMEIYKHQPALQEKGESENSAREMIDLMKLMTERLEQSQKELEGRDALLLMINEYRRSIEYATEAQERKELYEIVMETALKVEKMEIAALGEVHPQRADTLQLLSTVALEQGEYQESVDYLKKAIEIGKASLGVKHSRVGQYYLRLARIHSGQGLENLALENFESAKEILKHSNKFFRILGSTLNDLGVLYMRRHEYDIAVINLLTALTYYERALTQNTGARKPLAPKDCPLSTDSLEVLRNLGECYMKMEEFDLARQHFAKVLELQKNARKVRDNVVDLDLGIDGVETFLLTLISDEGLAGTLISLGRAEAAANNHRMALQHFKDAVVYLNSVGITDILTNVSTVHSNKKQRNRQEQMLSTLYCIAEELRFLEEYDEALKYYNESLRLRIFSMKESANKEASTVRCALCLIGIANVYLGQKEFIRAKKLLHQARDFCIENEIPVKHPIILNIKQSLGEVMRNMGSDVALRKEVLVVFEERAVAHVKTEEYQEALVSLGAAMEIRKNALATLRAVGEDTAEQYHGIACLLRSFGSVYARMGDEENADRAYSDATRLFRRSGAAEFLEL